MEIGDLVGGRWRLTGQLGRGGFGQVFRAEDTSRVGLGHAAVKILHENTSPAERESFLYEVKKVAQMRHPNLVSYLDSGEYTTPDGSHRAYLVTELCDGSLADELSRRPNRRMAPVEVVDVVRDIASGLDHLHRRGLLHRDLKSPNILRAADGWKLADFGLTRDLSASGHYHRGDTLMGTPLYMAPELFSAEAAGKPADVYALGVAVHEALTGRFPYEAGSQVALIAQVTTRDPTLDPSLDSSWQGLISALMRRDPAYRPTARQVIGWLDHVPSQIGPAPSDTLAPTVDVVTVPPADPAPTAEVHLVAGGATRRRRIGPMAAGVALVVVALIAVAIPIVISMQGDGDQVPGGAALNTGGSRSSDADPPSPPGEQLADPQEEPEVPGTPADLPPEERLTQILPAASDGPEGYEFAAIAETELSDESCVGVDSPGKTYPGVAAASVEYVAGTQNFHSRVIIHETIDEAQKYLSAIERIRRSCNDQPIDSSEEITLHLSEGPVVELVGTDDVVTTITAVTSSIAAAESLAVYTRVGEITIASIGTHQATTVYFAELMVARATGAEEPEPVVPPSEIAEPLEQDPAASTRRTVGLFAEAELMHWLDTHDDADIDVIMDRTCSAIRGDSTTLEIVGSVDGVYAELEPDLRGDLESADLFLLANSGFRFYCPDEAGPLLGTE